jgi:hypothetical protein
MARRVLDSNVLINHWGFCRKRRQYEDIAADEAREWARQLIALYSTNAIVTPIYIEYLVGQPTALAVKLAEAYLDEFTVIDQGKIIDQDWDDAIRIARRIPPKGNLRQLGDCLIRAICNRLRYEVVSTDGAFPS